MHFSKLFASTALAGSVLAHVPGVVHDFPLAKKNVVEKRAECSRNNLLSALVRFQGNGTEEFCRSYLGGAGSGTVTVTVPGATQTVDATIAETPEPFAETVTEFGTVTALARRQAVISVPAGISQYDSDTRLSSDCACLLYSTSIFPGGSIATVTGLSDATATATATVKADGSSTTATSFQTVTIPRSSEEPTAEPTGCITGEPIIGCVLGSSIISAVLITVAGECPLLCESLTDCVAYQIGVDDTGAVAYCETLNAPAAEAFDAFGSEESAEYCSDFTIFNYTCPAIAKASASPVPTASGRIFQYQGVYLNATRAANNTAAFLRPTGIILSTATTSGNINTNSSFLRAIPRPTALVQGSVLNTKSDFLTLLEEGFFDENGLLSLLEGGFFDQNGEFQFSQNGQQGGVADTTLLTMNRSSSSKIDTVSTTSPPETDQNTQMASVITMQSPTSTGTSSTAVSSSINSVSSSSSVQSTTTVKSSTTVSRTSASQSSNSSVPVTTIESQITSSQSSTDTSTPSTTLSSTVSTDISSSPTPSSTVQSSTTPSSTSSSSVPFSTTEVSTTTMEPSTTVSSTASSASATLDCTEFNGCVTSASLLSNLGAFASPLTQCKEACDQRNNCRAYAVNVATGVCSILSAPAEEAFDEARTQADPTTCLNIRIINKGCSLGSAGLVAATTADVTSATSEASAPTTTSSPDVTSEAVQSNASQGSALIQVIFPSAMESIQTFEVAGAEPTGQIDQGAANVANAAAQNEQTAEDNAQNAADNLASNQSNAADQNEQTAEDNTQNAAENLAFNQANAADQNAQTSEDNMQSAEQVAHVAADNLAANQAAEAAQDAQNAIHNLALNQANEAAANAQIAADNQFAAAVEQAAQNAVDQASAANAAAAQRASNM